MFGTFPMSVGDQGFPSVKGFEVAPACLLGWYSQSLLFAVAHPQGAGFALHPKAVSSIVGNPNAEEILMKNCGEPAAEGASGDRAWSSIEHVLTPGRKRTSREST